MNMAVVLDLRGPLPTADIQNLLREALFSFHRAKDLGDRFSVFVAGREKTLVLDPNTFTHGQLIVALEELFHQQETSQSQEALLQALKRASVQVGENDDPTAPLGSSSILLLTSHALSADLPELERFAHRSALSGVPLSVFGLGSTVNSEELDRLALSGQGNRRILKSASEAREVAAKEIESSSTSVARAVRLNIRLAPGVKLVDVLGSYKFDPSQALRVKEAERSIDQRVARSLGIPSDRGDDDEGIQIVIPNYHAGDAHVILLDVVAPGPGEIAQVSAKFKDLVHLRNGTAQASLKISSTPSTEGPLEINVMKNRLALDLSNALVTASRKLDQEEVGEAIRTLEEFRQIMLDLPALQTALSGDPEILRDANMLSEYIALLRSPSMQQKSSKLFLRDSLAYAGKRKLAHHLSGTEMTS